MESIWKKIVQQRCDHFGPGTRSHSVPSLWICDIISTFLLPATCSTDHDFTMSHAVPLSQSQALISPNLCMQLLWESGECILLLSSTVRNYWKSSYHFVLIYGSCKFDIPGDVIWTQAWRNSGFGWAFWGRKVNSYQFTREILWPKVRSHHHRYVSWSHLILVPPSCITNCSTW